MWGGGGGGGGGAESNLLCFSQKYRIVPSLIENIFSFK